MVGEDADKVLIAIGVVVVAGVVYGVAKMLPPMGGSGYPQTPDQPPAVANYAPASQPSFVAAYSGPPPHTFLWEPPAPPARPATAAAPTRTAAEHVYSVPSLPVVLPDTIVSVPLTPVVSTGPAAGAGPIYPPTTHSQWYHPAPDSPLWVASVRLHVHGASIGDHPVLGALSHSPGVWLYDITVYNNSPDPVYVIPARLIFGDHSEEVLFPWNGQWSEGAADSRVDGGSVATTAGSFSPYCPGVSSPCFALSPAYSTISVYAENSGAFSSAPEPGDRTAVRNIRGGHPRQPLSMVFYETSPNEANRLNHNWQPQSGPQGHVDLLKRLDPELTTTKIEVPVPIDAAPSFPA